jgi:hypothetical protein
LEIQAQPIMRGINQVTQAIMHAENEENRGKYPQRDMGTSVFEPKQGWATDPSSFGHGRRGYSPPFPRVGNVRSELLQYSPNRERN